MTTSDIGGEYSGKSLGLPPSGRGSLAPLGKRVVALFIDWIIALVITNGLIAPLAGGLSLDAQSIVPLAVFVVMTIILVATTGRTLGHAAMGLMVIPRVRQRLSWLQATIRTVLIALVIPPVVWDKDGRGLHDIAAGTIIVRSR
ncbi:RDD family protein [Kribbia dieselivorans]|uniref:RDD family protein n=1 Tax=Kribbia dieselivorans TaxID=331526 RepID=UPI000839474A|nr:RDD family protein [Kribbia dieselivorans]